jgi:hypothetical protein
MADLSESTPTSSMDMAYNALLEADLARQFRRARRLMAGRTFSDELRLAVSGKRILVTGASSGIRAAPRGAPRITDATSVTSGKSLRWLRRYWTSMAGSTC